MSLPRLSAANARVLTKHRDRVERAVEKLDAARAERNDAIKFALKNREGVEREIAEFSGISRSRISQMRKELGKAGRVKGVKKRVAASK